MQTLRRPVQHADGLDHGDGDRVVGPHASVEQADIVLRDVLPEVGGSGSGRQGRIDGKRPEIRLESLMMRGLVDVDGLRHRIPCRYHQSGPRMTDLPIAQDITERIPQRLRVVLVSIEPPETAQLPAQEIGQTVPVLTEDLGAPALVQTEYL